MTYILLRNLSNIQTSAVCWAKCAHCMQLTAREELIKCVNESKLQKRPFLGSHLVKSCPVFGSFTCLWLYFISYNIYFISNRTRVNLKPDRDLSFQGSRSSCLVHTRVQRALIQMNHTYIATAPEFVLIEPNLSTVNTPLICLNCHFLQSTASSHSNLPPSI